MALQLKHGKKPDRNEPCPCGSRLKFKHCHGDVLKQEVCNRVANETMVQLIRAEQRKKGIPVPVVCPDCGGTPELIKQCEFCEGVGKVTEDQIKERYEEFTEGRPDEEKEES